MDRPALNGPPALSRFLAFSIFTLLALLAMPTGAQTLPAQQDLASRLAAEPHAMAIYVTGAGRASPIAAAHGLADPARNRPLTVDTPFRIASNTKTFVAATVLRLWEEGRIDLDAPIAPLLTPSLDAILRADGYATDRITVRQLLSHSAGLFDHASDPRYLETVLADPGHVWTREEQVHLATSYADPQSPPGTKFQYSDTGYILLGDIVERITGQSLAGSVRQLLGLDRLGLGATWWEIAEPAPQGVPPKARQWLDKVDASDFHASVDLYGGGGLVMSPRDLATFFAALFEGRVFKRPETLKEMMWQGPHEGAERYRLGLSSKKIGEADIFCHGGFWGTQACYAPASRIAISGMSTNQQGYRNLVAIIDDFLANPR